MELGRFFFALRISYQRHWRVVLQLFLAYDLDSLTFSLEMSASVFSLPAAEEIPV